MQNYKKGGSVLPVLVVIFAIVAGFLVFRTYHTSNVAGNASTTDALANASSSDAVASTTAVATSTPRASGTAAPTNSTTQTAAVTSGTKTAATNPGRVSLPNTGGTAAAPNISVPTSTQTNDAITVTFSESPFVAGETYTITISPKILPERTYSDVKVELVQPANISAGPLLIASYTKPISEVPRVITWTLPKNIDTSRIYAIRVTYNTTNVRGETGLTYVANSSSFIIQNAVRPDSRVILAGLTQAGATSATQGQKGVEMLRLRITAQGDENAVVTHLALGGRTGNDVFNSIENVRASVGRTVPLTFSNEYLLGTSLWKFEDPIVIPAGGSVNVIIYADIKPGAGVGDEIYMTARGGRASATFEGSATGRTVTVTR